VVSDLLEQGAGGSGAILRGGEGLHAGRHGLSGVGERSLVDLHGSAELGFGGSGATLVEGIATDDCEDGDHRNDAGEDGLLAVLFSPMHAAGGEGDKLVLLLQLTLGCVIHESSVLRKLKRLPGPPPAHRLSLAGKGLGVRKVGFWRANWRGEAHFDLCR